MSQYNPWAAEMEPNLYLAQLGTDIPDVASGSSVMHGTTSMAVPGMIVPPLNGSVDDVMNLGQLPGQVPDLDLAMLGCDGDADDSSPAQNDLDWHNDVVNDPTFTAPSLEQPTLAMKAGDIAGATIRHNDEMQPDPLMPDLSDYEKPIGLNIHGAATGIQLTVASPSTPDDTDYDHPPQMQELVRDVMTPDPQLPDLQSPILTQEVTMDERPGELSPYASASPDNDGDDDDGGMSNTMPPYRAMYRTPDLARRQRHLDPLYQGLRGELDV